MDNFELAKSLLVLLKQIRDIAIIGFKVEPFNFLFTIRHCIHDLGKAMILISDTEILVYSSTWKVQPNEHPTSFALYNLDLVLQHIFPQEYFLDLNPKDMEAVDVFMQSSLKEVHELLEQEEECDCISSTSESETEDSEISCNEFFVYF